MADSYINRVVLVGALFDSIFAQEYPYMCRFFGKCPARRRRSPDFFVGEFVQSLDKADVSQVITLTNFQGTSVKDRGRFIISFINYFAHIYVQIAQMKNQGSEQDDRQK